MITVLLIILGLVIAILLTSYILIKWMDKELSGIQNILEEILKESSNNSNGSKQN